MSTPARSLPGLLARLALFGAAALPFVTSPASGAVPTAYKGTPYMGTPQAIPGRIELANLDVGGEGVSYHADHRRVNAVAEGYSPISGDDYRPTEKDLPNICKTNGQNPDTYVDGKPYPPSTASTRSWYYMGYAHAHDWVRVTVDVKQAGMYSVSSTWASANANWGLSLWFNDGSDATVPLDGVNKSGKVVMPGTSDYHKWKDYPNFTKVQLSAGVQVLTFHLEQEDHLQYGFLQFHLMGADGTVPPYDPTEGFGGAGTGGGTDGGVDATGTAGTAGGTAGTSGTGTAGSSGTAGTSGSTTGTAGTSGSTTGTAGTSGSATGTAGTSGSTTGAAGTSGSTTGAAGTTSPPRQSSSGGCAVGAGRTPSAWAALAGLVVLGGAMRRRRRAR